MLIRCVLRRCQTRVKRHTLLCTSTYSVEHLSIVSLPTSEWSFPVQARAGHKFIKTRENNKTNGRLVAQSAARWRCSPNKLFACLFPCPSPTAPHGTCQGLSRLGGRWRHLSAAIRTSRTLFMYLFVSPRLRPCARYLSGPVRTCPFERRGAICRPQLELVAARELSVGPCAYADSFFIVMKNA